MNTVPLDMLSAVTVRFDDAIAPLIADGSLITDGSLRRDRVLPGPFEHSERFVFLEHLGGGGQGEVFRAFDRDLGRVVAIKRAHSADVQRFAAEVQTAGALEHPSIVPVYDLGVDAAGHPYFVMRYVDGESLASIIERLAGGDPEAHRIYCFERRMMIFQRLCEAVAFAHARGVLHCDIKPDNVMIGRFGEVFLTDWGISRRIEASAGNVSGTPAYMAPEQARGDALDVRTDVHGLCALLYELLVLKPYIDLNGYEVAAMVRAIPVHRPPHPSDVSSPVQSRVPMDLGWFVMRGLERDPARRYRSVAEMGARLERRAEGRVPVQCAQTLVKRSSSELVRLLERWPLMLPVALAAGIFVWAFRVLH